MKNFLRGVVFLAFFCTPLLCPTEANFKQGMFLFFIVLAALVVLMRRLNMLDLPDKYRYENGKEK